MDEDANIMPLKVHPLRLKGKSLSFSGKWNWIVSQVQQKHGI